LHDPPPTDTAPCANLEARLRYHKEKLQRVSADARHLEQALGGYDPPFVLDTRLYVSGFVALSGAGLLGRLHAIEVAEQTTITNLEYAIKVLANRRPQ
jgi:hypothetical protein